jgi:predicted CoA-binding protein
MPQALLRATLSEHENDNPRRKPMDAARMPEPEDVTDGPSRQDLLLRIYEQTKTIAVVGASANEKKAAHVIPSYLHSQGYRIIPVNPKGGEILGERVYPSLEEIDAPVDVVDVFRPPAEAEAIAREAVGIGAEVLWFQPGTHTKEAVQLAAEAGLTVVAGRCMGATHGELGLGAGPSRTVRP